MAHARSLCAQRCASPGHRIRILIAALGAACAGLALLAAPGARAASIGIDPSFKLLACGSPGCDALTVQLGLALGEVDVDAVGFEITVSNGSLVGLTPGPVPGNPIAGYNGGMSYDGIKLIGSLDTVPNTFDDGSGLPQTIDLATIPIYNAGGAGTVEFRFLSAEVFCDTCNGGTGQFYPITNGNNELLATVITPEPGPASLLALGLLALGASRRRTEGGVR